MAKKKVKRFEWLTGIVKRNKFALGVEVGTGKGNTARYLMKNCPDLKLVEVAWYPNNRGPNSGEKAKKLWMQRISPFKNRIVTLEMPSHKAAEMVSGLMPQRLDFAFIDASHNYQDVLLDITSWDLQVRQGGIICGHDFGHPKFPGVEQAVREYFGEDNFSFDNDKDWVWWHVKKKEKS